MKVVACHLKSLETFFLVAVFGLAFFSSCTTSKKSFSHAEKLNTLHACEGIKHEKAINFNIPAIENLSLEKPTKNPDLEKIKTKKHSSNYIGLPQFKLEEEVFKKGSYQALTHPNLAMNISPKKAVLAHKTLDDTSWKLIGYGMVIIGIALLFVSITLGIVILLLGATIVTVAKIFFASNKRIETTSKKLDIVYLIDGTVIKGQIMGSRTGALLKIRSTDGEIYKIKKPEIEKISQENNVE